MIHYIVLYCCILLYMLLYVKIQQTCKFRARYLNIVAYLHVQYFPHSGLDTDSNPHTN